MRTQPYLLTLLALFTGLTPQHGVSATFSPTELLSRNEIKIVQANILVAASSRQGKVVQAREDESG
ncbi:hypothetical protein H6F78_00275 [Coleofasciculus sp. FACHB-64]|nr:MULTISPECIES: hypothetical protein [unclassified Coleofasciculus]MBD1839514.1 hypothetical protein [Coleofasciculus sp. FACHB-501]MBD2044082.1 hypothetical protein [Coleofasciculus sp. FACHB-64]